MPEFTLDAYAARSCPVKTQNAFNPLLRGERGPVDESLAELFAGGIEFEERILAEFIAAFDGDVADLRGLTGASWTSRETACLEAMRAGRSAIIGGVLPLDRDGHRSGHADLWLRGQDQPDGTPGYYPVEVKAHRVLERRQGGPGTQIRASALTRPSFSDAAALPTHAFRVSSREGDLLQLAHYWRLLAACGFAAGGEPQAGLIGTDLDRNGAHTITWIPLADKQIRTFSRTAAEGWRLRSPLERYDHEHAFRLRVVNNAVRQTGSADDPPLLVRPIVIRECEHCTWWEICRPQLPDEDLSLRIDKSPLDVREISVLRAHGIQTITQLAGCDLDALLPEYLPEVAHRPGAEDRLRLAARRARLMARGVELERIGTGPVAVPGAPLEIDFDIETAANDRVYLWGFYVTDRDAGTQRFVEFSRFDELDAQAELDLAHEAVAWLRQLADGDRDIVVYHYSDYETVRLRRLAAQRDDPVLTWCVGWARDHFCDLFALVKANFFGVHGLGLKVVAHVGAGFSWRDDDPSGLNSQAWFDEAVHGETPEARAAARVRVLEYNEDDVRATAALRGWLRGLT